MTGATCCSGIGAPETAMPNIDWKWCAEIEKFPCAVLAARHPQNVNLGDMTAPDFIERALAFGRIDLLVAGTPCQAFSVAGDRRSLEDSRGNLTLRFVEIIDAIDPGFVLWENVPGVLSTHDNAFGCFLAGLVGADEAIVPISGWTNAGMVSGPRRNAAWRVQDAQYFGLAQRRKRVFVVSCPRNGADPRQILFECEGVPRHSPPRRETRESLTHDIAASLTSSGTGVRRAGGESRGQDPVIAVCPTLEGGGNNTGGTLPPGTTVDTADSLVVANSLNGNSGRQQIEQTYVPVASTGETAHCLNAGAMGRIDYETETLVSHAHCFDARQNGVISYGDMAGPLDQNGHANAVAFKPSHFTRGKDGALSDVAPPLSADADKGDQDTLVFDSNPKIGDPLAAEAHPPAIAFYANDSGNDAAEDLAPTLRAMEGGGGNHPAAAGAFGVRRLTPVECERLQGYRDHFTAMPKTADGPRYKALGNSMAVPVVRFLIERIMNATTAR